MQAAHPQGITRAQANAIRTTCTSCHQRKVKCDAHDRGFPCSRCCKSGSADSCQLHRKSRRVSRAKREAIKTELGTAKTLSPRPAATSTTARSSSSRNDGYVDNSGDSIVAAAPSTLGSLFLQTVIAEEEQQALVASAAPTLNLPSHTQSSQSQPQPLRPALHPLQRIQPAVQQSRPSHTSHTIQHQTPQSQQSQSRSIRPTTAQDATTPQSDSDSSSVLPGHGADGVYKKYLVEFIDQPSLIDRPIDREFRTLYVGSPLSNLHFLLCQQVNSGMSPAGKNVEKKFRDGVVHYSATKFSKGILTDDGLPLEAFQLPSKRTVDLLLTAYFTHINPGFPVVDEIIFMEKYRARDPKNPPSLLLLQAILVAGAHALYRNEPGEIRDGHKACYFRRAKMLIDARFERNRDTIVQAALLMTWHVDGPEDAAANAWHWLGFAARTAMGLGMHRNADGCTLLPHSKRLWRRVWWLLFQCDIMVALQYGRPPAIHLEDCDVKPLTAEDMKDCGPNTRVDYTLQMTELCILLSIDVLRSQFRSPAAAAAAAAAAGMTPEDARRAALRRTDEALAHWSLQLPPSLHLNNAGHNNGNIPENSLNVWTASLHLTYNTVLILLHRQATMPTTTGANGASTNNHDNSDDIEICTNAAVAIQQIFESICSSGQLVCLWSASINSLFTALIQLSWEVRRSAVRRTSSSTRPLAAGSQNKKMGGNPLLAVAALQRYDSALSSLRQLATFWANAQAIVQFFEQSVRLEGDAAADSDSTEVAEPAETSENIDVTGGEQASDFTTADIVADLTDRSILYADVEAGVIQAQQDPTDISQLMTMGNPTLSFGNIGQVHSHPLDPWAGNDYWQRIYWQPPESADDFLFSF